MQTAAVDVFLILLETGIRLSREDLTPVGTVHAGDANGMARVGFVFTVEHNPSRHGEPVNAERSSAAAWPGTT